MKRIGNLYNKICDIDVIMNMYDRVVRVNTKNKNRVELFDNFYSSNIKEIKEELISKTYNIGKYNIFLIRDPKLRIIMSQSIKDKIINHLVAKYFLVDVFDKTLINSNCATRKGKGTRYALNLFKRYINDYRNKYSKFYILKFDISKYFYNIDHNIVKNLISNKIKDKDVLNIIFNIIDSTDMSYVNEEIKLLKCNEISRIKKLNISDSEKILKINEVNEIPFYLYNKGLPIGNMTSQVIATFYLNELDNYIHNILKVYYVRYMDDGCLIHYDKNYLRKCFNDINIILNRYGLKLNNKSKIYTSNEEIEFLGFRFCIRNKLIIKVCNKTKKRFIRNVNECNLVSYINYFKFGNCNSLLKKIKV